LAFLRLPESNKKPVPAKDQGGWVYLPEIISPISHFIARLKSEPFQQI
jgi:hypothetical protein